MKKKIVLKIGSSTLTAGTKMISRGKIEDIGRQILALREKYDIVLVSSGAIATARQFININGRETMVESKQAMAAIGQPILMQIYNQAFSDFGIQTAQCLMTYDDFARQTSSVNTLNTINELLKYGVVPIINENDTTAVEEIVLGDNDKLSALVAVLIKADLLVLASDIDGLFDKNPHLYDDAKLITEITDLEQAEGLVEEKTGGIGTGGMSSKLAAAKICKQNNIETWIMNGGRNNFLVEALEGKSVFTRVL
ncbi:MAG: Glutamate 5-kinase [Parcubacteria group bacterium GW2011_GWE2_38_18]|nr:MAG: Glutamate 5-kinase [Parcubacteria group bacterium GW2011_GWE2_38_18]